MLGDIRGHYGLRDKSVGGRLCLSEEEMGLSLPGLEGVMWAARHRHPEISATNILVRLRSASV